MDKFRIVSIKARLVLDSRGIPTVEAEVAIAGGVVERAIVPSGASTGSFEAHELRDNDKTRFQGKGVSAAIRSIDTEIAPMLMGQDIRRAPSFDQMMIDLDGTIQKSRLGANAILAVSLACARAASKAEGMPLYRHIGGVFARRLPVPLVNVINGGAHADNGLDFQEFMIVPLGAQSFSEALRMSSEFFMALKSNLKQRGLATNVGDEGGFAPDLRSSRDALDVLVQTGKEASLPVDGTCFALALDVAASEFHNDGHYTLDKGKRRVSSEQMVAELMGLCDNYPIMSIEDGLDEEDWTGWQNLTQKISGRIQLVGDDLFVTNTTRLAKGIKIGAGNAILIKVNQIGTLGEAADAVTMAHRAGFNAIMSHRSGESEDTTIADLSVGLGCSQIKTGSLSRSERVAKYNRLLRIEEELGIRAVYAGPDLIAGLTFSGDKVE